MWRGLGVFDEMTCNWKTQADEIEFSEVISMKGVENENKNVKQMRIE